MPTAYEALQAIYAVEIFKFQQGGDAMLPYYIFFLPDLFIIHYSLFTNSVLLSILGGDNEDIGDIGDRRARFSSGDV